MLRRIVPLSILLCAFLGAPYASAYDGKYKFLGAMCAPPDALLVRVDISQDPGHFADDDNVVTFLRKAFANINLRGTAQKVCSDSSFSTMPPNPGILVQLELPGNGKVRAQRAANSEAWKVTHNDAKTARQREKSDFDAKFKTAAMIATRDLMSNPFRFEGKLVVLTAQFDRMVSSDSAIFSNILVSNVPRTRFAGNEWVVLAIKVVGLRKTTTSGREQELPHGEFQGALICSKSQCIEYK